jgi:hypothetical protein
MIAKSLRGNRILQDLLERGQRMSEMGAMVCKVELRRANLTTCRPWSPQFAPK